MLANVVFRISRNDFRKSGTARAICGAVPLLLGLWSSAVAASSAGRGGVIVFDGDSVSKGYGVRPDQAPDRQLALILGPSVSIYNKALSGWAVSAVLAKFEKDVMPLYDRSAPFNFIAFHAGDNDIAQGRSGADAYAALTQYLALAHRQGWKVIVSTELARPAWSPKDQTELSKYNSLVLQNSAKADDVIDYAREPPMNRTADRFQSGYFCKDAIHPSAKGYRLLAGLLANAIEHLQKNGH